MKDIENFKKWMSLFEAQKPIVYYVDRATPKSWVPYDIKQGIEDWQLLFELRL